MDEKYFLDICKEVVCNYTNEHQDNADNKKLLQMMYLWYGAAKHCNTIKHF